MKLYSIGFVFVGLFLSGCMNPVHETIPKQTIDPQKTVVRGSCDAREENSTCIDFLGTSWDEKDTQELCQMGVWSHTPCSATAVGGCATSNHKEAGIIIWYYSDGESGYTGDDLGFAKRACSDETQTSQWIEGVPQIIEAEEEPEENTENTTPEENTASSDTETITETIDETQPTSPVLESTTDERIEVEFPQANDTISNPVIITGKARGGWFFEATFPIDIVNWNGLIVGEGFAQAQGEWMTEEFVPFEATVSYDIDPQTPYSHGWIILNRHNASGLPEHAAAIEIPVVFESLVTESEK